MIVVTMAKHKGIEPGRVNSYKVDIVDHCFRREPEIHEDIARFHAASRLGVHGEAELTDQRPAGWFVAANAPAEVLDVNIGQLPARRHSKLIAVNHNPNSYTIKLRNRAGDRIGFYWLRTAQECCDDCAKHGGTAATHHIASMHCVALANSHGCLLLC